MKTSSFFPSKVKLQAGSDSKQQLLFCGSDNGTEELPLTANPEVKGLELSALRAGPQLKGSLLSRPAVFFIFIFFYTNRSLRTKFRLDLLFQKEGAPR